MPGPSFTSACEACKKVTPDGKSLQVCSRCHSVKYCNADCQRSHWKAHKEYCKTARATYNEHKAMLENVQAVSSAGDAKSTAQKQQESLGKWINHTFPITMGSAIMAYRFLPGMESLENTHVLKFTVKEGDPKAPTRTARWSVVKAECLSHAELAKEGANKVAEVEKERAATIAANRQAGHGRLKAYALMYEVDRPVVPGLTIRLHTIGNWDTRTNVQGAYNPRWAEIHVETLAKPDADERCIQMAQMMGRR